MIMAIKRGIIVFLGLVLQFGFSILVQLFFHEHITIVAIIYQLISILIVLKILKDSVRLSNDLPWIILILLFPIFGTILLITLGRSFFKSKLLRNILKHEKEYNKFLEQDEDVEKQIMKRKLDNLQYIINRTGYPVSSNNYITYYDFGEKFYPELLKELKKAEKFIFMEYFIINHGKMWEGILEIF